MCRNANSGVVELRLHGGVCSTRGFMRICKAFWRMPKACPGIEQNM